MPVTLSLLAGAGQQFFDNNGVMLTGGKLFTYLAGTTTPNATYTDVSGNSAHTNPIILDAAGRVPGGEIWLTLGVGYKFVLKTSTDILIATYDNIPSSALPPAANDADSIMYEQGYTVTAGSFVVGRTYRIVSVGTTDFTLIGATSNTPGVHFIATGAGTGTGTAESSQTVENKLRQIVSFKDFGAVGDGVTNDAAAIQTAITQMSAGGTIDGQGLTYRVDSTITGLASNTTIQNATFDFSQQPDSGSIDRGFNVTGTIGANVALTSNTAVLTSTVNVGSTSGFAADDLVFLSSSKVWDALQAVTYGQYARVKTVVSGTQLALYEPVQLAFNTADNAVIVKVTPVQNAAFKNCHFIGANNLTQAQNALYIQYGENCRVEACRFKYFDYAALGFYRCYKSIADKVSVFAARNAGNAYGVAIWGGCYGCSVVNGFGEDTRHYVTIGDNDGINMYSLVNACQVLSSKDAGLDSHAAAMFTTFSNNMISMSSDRAGTSNHDGLIMQGAHSICAGNTIIGAKGTGISFVMLIGDGTPTTVKAIDNTVIMDDEGYLAPTTTGMNGIYVNSGATHGPDNIEAIQISNNSFGGGQAALNGYEHIIVAIDKPNAVAKNINIIGNASAQPAKGVPCYVLLRGASVQASNITVTGNNLRSTDAWPGVYVYSLGAGSAFNDVHIASNVIDTPSSGVYLRGGGGSITNAVIGKNTYKNVTSIYTADGTLTNINTSDADAIVASSTLTVAAPTITRGQFFIFNRGAAQVVTLPSAASYPSRTLYFKNIQAQTVDSATSNIVPIGDSVAGTAILPATDGAWAMLVSNGTNWVITARG